MGTWRRPSCTPMVWPTISGKMVESRDQVRSTSLRPPAFMAVTRRMSLASTYGPFLSDLLMGFLQCSSTGALSDDELVSRLAMASLLTHGDLAPLGLGLTADGCFALTTTVRMVAGVH